MSKKTRKACLSSDDDDFQFGPWLRSVAPKFSHKKSNFSHSKPREENDDGIHVSEDEEGRVESSQIQHQLTAPLLVGKSNKMVVRCLLDGPTRISVEWENLKSSDPQQVSIFERDTIPPKIKIQTTG